MLAVLGNPPNPQLARHPAINFHSVRAHMPSGKLDLCPWTINMIQSQHGNSVGNARSLQVAGELRAGNPCTELSAAWAVGMGLWLQFGSGTGRVSTTNWAFVFQF